MSEIHGLAGGGLPGIAGGPHTGAERPGPVLFVAVASVSEEKGVTEVLERVRRGEGDAAAELLVLVLGELRAIAERHMRGQQPWHTLEPTALVNEAYLRLFKNGVAEFNDRGHFLKAASRAMRCVLVDHARAGACQRRAAPGVRLPIEGLAELFEERAHDLVALDAALERLAEQDPRGAQVVELLFFGGRTEAETAEVLGVSERTVQRDWQMARAWLRRELE